VAQEHVYKLKSFTLGEIEPLAQLIHSSGADGTAPLKV